MTLLDQAIRELIPRTLHNDAQRYERLLDQIKHGVVFASLDSPYSQRLQTILGAYPDLISDAFKEKLATVELYGVNISVCNACATLNGDKRQIVIADGLLHLINFYAQYIAIMPVLQALRADKTLEVDGIAEVESDIFSLAVTAAALHFVETGLGIVTLSDIMGETLKFNSHIAFLSASIFLIGHELGHLELGHLSEEAIRPESSSLVLAIQEAANRAKEEEIAADTYAYQCFAEEYRIDNISGILILFSVFSLLETMIVAPGQTHPLTINRMMNLVMLAAAGGDPAQTEAAGAIITAEVERYLRLQQFRDQHRLEGVSRLLSQTMPLDKAHHIIDTIKGRIRTDQVKLEQLF